MERETTHECLTASQIRDRDHGVGIGLDDIRSALAGTRMLRLATEVLGDLPPDIETAEVRAALWQVHEALCKQDLVNLRTYGLSMDFLIIRPINPMNPPEPEVMKQITAAIRTLSELELIVPAD
jgi:hypothetical protein